MKALQYFFTNVNLVLPVVAAVVIIVSAIVFICVFRAKHAQMMKPGNSLIFFILPQKKLAEPLELVKKTMISNPELQCFLVFLSGWT